MHDRNQALSGILEEMTIDDVRALAPEVVVLGIGSTEPHGPHLPYGTDTMQVDAVCRAAVRQANTQGGRVLLYPTLPIGNNVNFKAFPFACRIGVQTLMQVLLDIVASLEEDGIRKIVLVNGHGGNTDTLRATLRACHDRRGPDGEGAFVALVSCGTFTSADAARQIEHRSEHAGEAETSAIMHLRPELVRTALLADNPVGMPVLEALRNGQVSFVRPWHLYVPTSAGGETRSSTAAKGQALMDTSAAGLAEFLSQLSAASWHADFPYPPRDLSGATA